MFQENERLTEINNQIRRIEQVKEDLETKKPVVRGVRRARTSKFDVVDFITEKKIQDRVKKDKKYLLPVEKKQVIEDLATDVSVIIGNIDEFVWEVQTEEPTQKRESILPN